MIYAKAAELLRRAEDWPYGRLVQEGLDLIQDAVSTIAGRKGSKTKVDIQRAIAIAERLGQHHDGVEFLWCDRREQRRDPLVCAEVCADTEGEWKTGSRERIRDACFAWRLWSREQGDSFDLKVYKRKRRALVRKTQKAAGK